MGYRCGKIYLIKIAVVKLYFTDYLPLILTVYNCLNFLFFAVSTIL